MERSEQINELAAALVKVQAEIRPAIKDHKNDHLKNKYADLNSVWAACRDSLQANGFAVIQTPEAGPPEVLRTTLVHSSGQWVSGTIRLAYGENEKGRSLMQSMGSAISYARRYGLAAVVGVITEDDDGQSAGGGGQRREDRRRDERPSADGAAGPGPVVRLIHATLHRMDQQMPAADEGEVKSRKARLLNGLISDAIATEGFAEADIERPRKDGKGMCRDTGKGLAMLDRLHEHGEGWPEFMAVKLDAHARKLIGLAKSGAN